MSWAEQLAAWAIPEEIMAQAPESPWGFPPALFAPPATPADTPSRQRALEALPDGGSVLDVGCGGGAGSLALVPPAGSVTGVDTSPAMLAVFAESAAEAGVAHQTIEGSWPRKVERHDVVVCHHVLYNVSDLVPFVSALTDSAHRRVVCELTAVHPQASLNDLWQHFWGLARPTGPTAEDAADVIRSTGVDVQVERWQRPNRHAAHADRTHMVEFIRRRLCLPADRDTEIESLLPGDAMAPPSDVVTIWWNGRSGS